MYYQKAIAHLNPREFGRVAVLLGGTSSEREVSLQSGQGVYTALKQLGVDAFCIDIQGQFIPQLQNEKIDTAFIALHGGQGEGGGVQAVLEALNIPFTGSAHAASALCMDKYRCKQIFTAVGLPTSPFHLLTTSQDLENALTHLTFPLAVKPNHGGSTIGFGRVASQKEFSAVYTNAAQLDDEVLVEQWLDGTEYTVAILNGQTLPSIRIVPKTGIYDYEAKYVSEETGFFCPSGLEPEYEKTITQLAFQAYTILGCTGWGRVDFIQDKQGQFWLLEVNTIPGLTSHSLVPMAGKAVGLSYADVVAEILATSRTKSCIQKSVKELITS